MAKQNVINRATQDLTIDSGASGDSFIQFAINGTGEFRIGVDDDASDAFKVSQGGALGADDTFVMSAVGERTMPLQSAFLAYLGAYDNDVTGKDIIYTLGSRTAMTEMYDQNNDFNVNGTFTAPVTGRYWLSVFLRTSATGFDGGMTYGCLTLITSNRNYCRYWNPYGTQALGSGVSINVDVIADMDATDTAIVTLEVTGGAANTLRIYGGTTVQSFFAGILLA